MSASVSYSYDREVAIVRAQDHYTPDDLVEAVIAALEDPERPLVRGLLIDLRDSRSFNSRTERDVVDVHRFFETRREHFGGRVGLVPPHRAPARLLNLVSELAEDSGFDAYVFHDAREAREWLRRGAKPADRAEARRVHSTGECAPSPPPA